MSVFVIYNCVYFCSDIEGIISPHKQAVSTLLHNVQLNTTELRITGWLTLKNALEAYSAKLRVGWSNTLPFVQKPKKSEWEVQRGRENKRKRRQDADLSKTGDRLCKATRLVRSFSLFLCFHCEILTRSISEGSVKQRWLTREVSCFLHILEMTFLIVWSAQVTVEYHKLYGCDDLSTTRCIVTRLFFLVFNVSFQSRLTREPGWAKSVTYMGDDIC